VHAAGRNQLKAKRYMAHGAAGGHRAPAAGSIRGEGA
jgi:hypothetical protein